MAKQTKKNTKKNTRIPIPFLSIEAVAIFIIVYDFIVTFQLGFLGKFFLIRFFIGIYMPSVECAEFLRGSGCYSVDMPKDYVEMDGCSISSKRGTSLIRVRDDL